MRLFISVKNSHCWKCLCVTPLYKHILKCEQLLGYPTLNLKWYARAPAFVKYYRDVTYKRKVYVGSGPEIGLKEHIRLNYTGDSGAHCIWDKL